MSRRALAIVPVGPVPAADVEMVVPAVAAAFARDVVVSEAVDLPVSARDERRRQYLSTALLDVVERARRPAWERLLGIADVDLFAAGLNFVFGEADPRAGVAVMSLARLRHADTEIFRRRAETEAIHELGHAYGLGHCGNPRCVMWFSNTLAETDRKGTRFCAVHARDLARALER